ncbi:MAG: DUF1990 family protein [Phycicoccus sp.]
MVELLPASGATALRALPFSYAGVGATDHEVHGVRGAAGAASMPFSMSAPLRRTDLDAAAHDLLTWRVHERAGLRVASFDLPLVAGTVVAMRLGVGPPALRIACRVVYVVERPDVRGFSYGTLPGHPEAGEERFAVERTDDGSLRFTVSGFSHPATVPARLAGPLGRAGQRWMTRRYLRALDTLDDPDRRTGSAGRREPPHPPDHGG